MSAVPAMLPPGAFVEHISHGPRLGEHTRCSGDFPGMSVRGADEDSVLVLFGLRFHFGELPTVFSSGDDPVYAHGYEEDDVESEDAGCDNGGCFVCHCG